MKKSASVRFSRWCAAVAVVLLVPVFATAAPITVSGNALGGLATASGDLSISAGTLTLTLTNTSPFDARITGIGFDFLDGDFAGNNSSGLNGFAGNAPGFFDFEDGSAGNVPQFNSAVLDIAWITGPNFAGGSPNNGLAPTLTLVFTAIGPFPALSNENLASALYVRFQRVGATGDDSDVGRGTHVVPEPATVLLLGAGLVAVARRHRRPTAR